MNGRLQSVRPRIVERDFDMRIVCRTLAGCLAFYITLNLPAAARSVGAFDPNLWWIDLRTLGPTASWLVLVSAAAVLSAWTVSPACSAARRRATLAVLLLLIATASVNALVYGRLVGAGELTSRAGFPMSLVVAGMLAVICREVAVNRPAARRRPWRSALSAGATAIGCIGLFALGQMWCFGQTDYRRPADAVVVFGARAYADGRCSTALADRVRTACRLYHEQRVDHVIMSGGPGDGPVHETDAMRSLAISLGVPAEAIRCDRAGVNTRATCVNTAAMFDQLGVQSVLAVSHFYHLPRVKMTYQFHGVEVFTVPAEQRYALSQTPYLLAREVAALWYYWSRQVT